VKAVQIMAAAMKQTPQSYTLLHTQSDFLKAKGNHEWALKLARQAVNCAPSEFVTWEKLTELYIELGQYDSVRDLFSNSFVFSLTLVLLGAANSKLVSHVYLQWS
jgi:Flp pilus assembly protein TadD